ncbi:MAG: hypothetical protein IT576_09475 [Verrucomicrobiales bacterium]|nr:hypothetical protein [Verrucomicrobiales bacterium]
MNAFIDNLISQAKAKSASVDWEIGNIWRAEDEIKAAICRLGKAQHPVADTTSPAHKGFQVWGGLIHIRNAKEHAKQETDEIFRSRGYLMPTVEAADTRLSGAICEILSY